jgi:hypothetical protein
VILHHSCPLPLWLAYLIRKFSYRHPPRWAGRVVYESGHRECFGSKVRNLFSVNTSSRLAPNGTYMDSYLDSQIRSQGHRYGITIVVESYTQTCQIANAYSRLFMQAEAKYHRWRCRCKNRRSDFFGIADRKMLWFGISERCLSWMSAARTV